MKRTGGRQDHRWRRQIKDGEREIRERGREKEGERKRAVERGERKKEMDTHRKRERAGNTIIVGGAR